MFSDLLNYTRISSTWSSSHPTCFTFVCHLFSWLMNWITWPCLFRIDFILLFFFFSFFFFFLSMEYSIFYLVTLTCCLSLHLVFVPILMLHFCFMTSCMIRDSLFPSPQRHLELICEVWFLEFNSDNLRTFPFTTLLDYLILRT